MAIYTIECNGSQIFNGWNKIEPKLHLELNSAGYLEFIDPLPNSITEMAIMNDTYVVFEENVPIFQGRPTESTRLYNNRVRQYVEGCYGYFNDSLVKPFVYSNVQYDTDGGATLSAQDMLSYILSQHNAQVAQNRQIALGTVTITGSLYRVWNYEKSIDALSNLRDELGGYMVMSYTNGGYTAVLNWYSTLPQSTGQTVQLGKNITDFNQKVAMSDIPTAFVPLGAVIEKIDQATPEQPADDTHILASDTAHLYLVGQNLTLCNRTDVNNGKDYLTNALASSLGMQYETKTFSDAGTAVELLAMANVYWARKVLQIEFTDVDVADLHYASGYQLQNDAIKFATNVTVIANKYNPPVSLTLPCSTMDIELDNAVKSISLGTLTNDALSDVLKKDNDDRDVVDDNLQDQIDDLNDKIGQGGGGGVTNVSYTPDVTSGVQLGTLRVDNQPTVIYAPDAGVNMRYVPLVLADLTVDITTIPSTYSVSCYDYDGNSIASGTPVSIYIAGGDVYVPEPTILLNQARVSRITKDAEFRVGSATYKGFAVLGITIPAHTAESMSQNMIDNLTVTISFLIGWNKDGWGFTGQTKDFTERANKIVFRQIIGTTGSHYYTMSPATTTGIGGVMVDGSDLSVDAQTGLISVGQETDQDVDDAVDNILSGV